MVSRGVWTSKNVNFSNISMKNQVCKQYPSKVLLRYLKSRREPSWERPGERLRTSGSSSERSQNACWQASEVSQMPQKTHKTTSKVARCTKTHLPSLYRFKPPSLHAFKPACQQGPRRDARSENNLDIGFVTVKDISFLQD